MASSSSDSHIEILSWLKTLPVAPEYHPTLAEFQDPIAYILKIEKEASQYGICKIIPPVPAPPKKNTIKNLNLSLTARNISSNPRKVPTFTTRQQQIGFCPRKPRPVQRPVWQSGDNYTLQQFEVKAKQFEKNYIKKGGKKTLSALEIETLFWKASVDKPFSVEYANDMPGSAFPPRSCGGKKLFENADTGTVAESAWNMRGIARANGSLLRFMKKEIPGVTSPMVYIAMMFSWFAWHVEDHDLHSLNYLHMGAGKTWYGVPRDAAIAFEEVVRVHGYGGEVNPLVTFAILGEKTTVMSPEVFIQAGIPCCRLVQNAGEFVVTFPRAYHSGFSHGFNCGEASNIATPEWLKVANDAAIRRASINHPPMVSHFQLLYHLALDIYSRRSTNTDAEPRSSRLKDKRKAVGEMIIKEQFVQSLMTNNKQLDFLLEKGSTCVLLPDRSSDISLFLNSRMGYHGRVKTCLSPSMFFPEELELSKMSVTDDRLHEKSSRFEQSGSCGVKEKPVSVYQRRTSSVKYDKNADSNVQSSLSVLHNAEIQTEGILLSDSLLDQGLLSCVTCGILSFACMAVVQPKEEASRYLTTADCSFDEWGKSILPRNTFNNEDGDTKIHNSFPERNGNNFCDPTSAKYVPSDSDQKLTFRSDISEQHGISGLALLASAYGDLSDSEEDLDRPTISPSPKESHLRKCSLDYGNNLSEGPTLGYKISSIAIEHKQLIENVTNECEESVKDTNRNDMQGRYSNKNSMLACKGMLTLSEISSSMDDTFSEPLEIQNDCVTIEEKSVHYNAFLHRKVTDTTQFNSIDPSTKNLNVSFLQRHDQDSSRMHVFCLEHALEVEKQLQAIGGAHILLLCHPEYPKMEEQAKSLARDLGIEYSWKFIHFREATKQDNEKIQSALDDEQAIPGNSDWAVKMGINLYYSSSMSKSPLYSKQMPYNSIIYKSFGWNFHGFSPTKPIHHSRRINRQKRIVMAGRWCGKVWMTNQVHPYLTHIDSEDEEENYVSHDFDQTIQENNIEILTQSVHSIMSEHSSPTVENLSKKMGRKRKQLVKSSAKKFKYHMWGSNIKFTGEEDSPKNSPSISERVVRGKVKPKLSLPDNSPPRSRNSLHGGHRTDEDSSYDSSPRSSGRILQGNHKTYEDLSENSSLGDVKSDEELFEPSPKSVRIYRKGLAKRALSPQGNDTNPFNADSLVKEGGPSTRLRRKERKSKAIIRERHIVKKCKQVPTTSVVRAYEEHEYQCDVEGCDMGFDSKQELALHKRNICPAKGCGKKFFSHKYLVQHRRVHMDDRPLKCPWKGCKMTFKWAWARTEHIRVHTGARPYVCREPGCGQTFRFVSDFSRHKRKTGHSTKKGKG